MPIIRGPGPRGRGRQGPPQLASGTRVAILWLSGPGTAATPKEHAMGRRAALFLILVAVAGPVATAEPVWAPAQPRLLTPWAKDVSPTAPWSRR
jgi:hypothetical protein